jgi:hypothetical protein
MFFFSDPMTKSCDHSQRCLRSGMLTLGVVILSLGAVAGAAVADDITFTTDITGANVTIDVGNTETYDFVVNPGHVVNNIIGDFTIKSGTNASADILFSVYDAFNGTGHVSGPFTANGTEIGVASLTAAVVPQSYTTEDFAVHSLNLLPGNYSVALHSTAGGIGADQYFFKNQGFSSTSNGTAISIGTSSSTATPEPSGILTGLGFLGTLGGGFLQARRRRRNR